MASVTLWRNLAATTGQRRDAPWAETFDLLRKPRRFRGEHEQPGWSPAVFEGNERKKANVREVAAIALDYDSGATTLDAAKQVWGGFYGFIHTTKSHTQNAHRFRVVLPLARSVTPEEHAELWQWAAKRAAAAGHRIDGQTKDPSRFWFMPSGDVECIDLTGETLDPDRALAEHRRDLEPMQPAPTSRPSVGHESDKRRRRYLERRRRYLEGAMDSAIAAVRSAQNGERNATLNAKAFGLGQLVASGALDAVAVREAMCGAGRAAGLGQSEIERTIASALAASRSQPRDVPEAEARPSATPKSSASSGGKTAAPMAGDFNLTDLGNGERFVAQHRESVRYSPQRRKWLSWSGERWQWDETRHVYQLGKDTVRAIFAEAARAPTEEQRSAVAKHAMRSESAERMAAMVKLAATEPGVAIVANALDADPWTLNAPNGTVDLRTGQLREHRRSDLITKSTLVPFAPDSRSDLWDRVLHDATAGDAELAAYLQRVAGYSLIGEPLERALFFVFGEPGTAKSTLLEALHGAFGDYAASADFETWLQRQTVGGNRGDLVRLAGARLVTSVEVRKGARWDEALVKRVTGGDEITAAAKFESEITFRPSFTLLLAANDAPRARDDDAGMWARMRRIPLTAVIPPERQDPSIKGRLREPEHAAAVLAWAVAGCLAYQREGFGRCAAVERSTADYRAEMDVVGGFLSECCAFEAGATVSKRDLRAAYEEWCRESGVRNPIGPRDFGAKLAERKVEGGKSGSIRLWKNVRLLSPDEVGQGTLGQQGTAAPESSSKCFLAKGALRENVSQPVPMSQGAPRGASAAASPERPAPAFEVEL
ncbi:MAG: hypothetical protein HYZ29_23445 [Myxococcales bacterium]|nr:hypothetical protein [Myxococcales bacterium]